MKILNPVLAAYDYIMFRYNIENNTLSNNNINWRDVQRKDFVNNVDKSRLGTITKRPVYKHTHRSTKVTNIQNKLF